MINPEDDMQYAQTYAHTALQTPSKQESGFGKQFKYSATKISYEKLVQQAKSKLIKTFLEREKRRQD